MRSLYFCFLLSSYSPLLAQSDDTIRVFKNAYYVEFLGNGGLYSVNYERLFYQATEVRAGLRVGASILPENAHVAAFLPVELNALIGKRIRFMEIGVGVTPTLRYLEQWDNQFNLTRHPSYFWTTGYLCRAGFRYYKPETGFVFRLGFVPIIYYDDKSPRPLTWKTWAGLSLGKSF